MVEANNHGAFLVLKNQLGRLILIAANLVGIYFINIPRPGATGN